MMEFFREVPVDMWVRCNYKGSYIFRKEPIPNTGVRRGSYYRTRIKKNKNYVAKLQEYKDLFPNDTSMNALRLHVISWRDDFNVNKSGKSWKKQKKRKQWR